MDNRRRQAGGMGGTGDEPFVRTQDPMDRYIVAQADDESSAPIADDEIGIGDASRQGLDFDVSPPTGKVGNSGQGVGHVIPFHYPFDSSRFLRTGLAAKRLASAEGCHHVVTGKGYEIIELSPAFGLH